MKNNFLKRLFVLTTSLSIIFNLVIRAQNISPDKYEYRENQRINTRTNIVATMYNVNSQVYHGTPEQIARQFLDENKAVFGISSISELRFIEVIESPAGKHVGFLQTFNGIPVFGSETVVSINKRNQVTMVINGNTPIVSQKSILASIPKENAINTAVSKINAEKRILVTQPKAELYIYQDSLYQFNLTWKINFVANKPIGDWQIFVDASTGKILKIMDISMRYVNGQGKVFKPDPITVLQNTSLTDQNNTDYQALQNAYKTETLYNLNDPVGGIYRIQGMYAKSEDIELPATAIVTSASSSFLYNRSQAGFEETNVYYFIDAQRQYIGGLGFSPKWNGYDYIRFDAHGYNGDDNSHYVSSGPYIAYGDGGIDDAEDQDVVLHEYGHALHDALMIGTGIGGTEESRVSEGSSDFLAVSYRKTLSTFQSNKVFPWDGNGETWNGRSLNSTSVYPTQWTGLHDPAGVLWASTIMDIETSSGIGRDVATTLLLTSFSYVSGSSTVIDHVNAIFQADRDVYGGSHLTVLSSIFNQRGFFYNNQVSGTISSNTTWSGNKYVTGNITVNSGVTLTISANTFIFFSSGISLTVNGTLNAVGTSSNGITFTKSGANNWSGIQFNSGSSGNLDYCTLQYAGNGIYCYNSSPTIKHSTIDNNSGTGLYLNYYSSPVLVGNNFRFNSSYGIRCESYSSPNLTDNGYPGSNVIRNNSSGGVLASYYSNPNLLGYMTYGNSVFDNTGYEIAASSNCSINARKVFWGIYATVSATDGSTIDNTDPLGDNPNDGRKIVADNSSNSISGVISLKVVAADLSHALDKQKDKKYDEAIPLFLEVFKNNKDALLGKYALSKIEECFTQAGKKDYLDYSKREIKPLLKDGSETYVVALELETHQMVNLGLQKEAIGNLQTILKKYNLNEAIEKNTLFSLGAFHNIFLGDKANSDKYFEELKLKYPKDELANQIEIIKGLGLAANSSVQGGDAVLPFEEIAPAAKTTVTEDAITNYPNPFNPTTKISFSLKDGGKVSLKVYDVLGKEVANLAEGYYEAGKHVAAFDGSNLASGIYFYRLVTPTATITKKMVLTK